MARRGVAIYCSAETAAAVGLRGPEAHIIKPLQQFALGSWEAKAFPAVHDVLCMGFLVANEDSKLLYLIDSAYCHYRFKGLTHILIGCNYSSPLLQESVQSGELPLVVARRTMHSHMSLETLCDFLRANDLSKVQEIHLLHMSDGHSNEEEFLQTIKKLTGKPTYAWK